jgi:hypothetical protein
VGKAIAYLALVAIGVGLLHATGLFDGMFDRGNLEEREAFWKETVAREAPAGTPKATVDALVARHGMSFECFHSSVTPPIEECRADDPNSKGGTAGHPLMLRLSFTFRGEALEKFETNPHVLR